MAGLLLAAVSVSAIAQSGSVADLELVITPLLPTTLRPGSVGTLVLSVTNQGPDTAGISPSGPVIIVSSSYLESMAEIDGRVVYFDGIDGAGSCVVYTSHIDPPPPQGPLYSSLIRFGSIPVGATRSCQFQYALNPQVSDTIIELAWEVQSPVDSDPNPGNNVNVLIFTVGSQTSAVPGLSTLGKWIMICLFLLVGLGAAASGRNSGG